LQAQKNSTRLEHAAGTARPILVMLLATSCLLLGGCATRGGKIPYDPANFGPPSAAPAGDAPYGWAVSPLDIIKVTVFRVPDLSGEYQVNTRGEVDLPLIGTVDARGKSPDQFAASLEQIYSQRYLNEPDITVQIKKTSQHDITVEGGVLQPGIYPLQGRTTLLGAIALARGMNPDNANPRRVAIFRKSGGQTTAAAFDVIAIRHGEMVDPVVYPGDTIVVDSTQLRALYRDFIQSVSAFAIFATL
jgi:polysaccharide biosynthesis/export protein